MKKMLILLLLASLLAGCVDNGNDGNGKDRSHGDTYWGVIEDISVGGYIGDGAVIVAALIALCGLVRLELFLQRK